MLSYTFGTNGIKPSHPYTINTFDETQIKKDVKEAKKHSDAVIVSAHWGNEGHHMENKTQERYAKVFCRCRSKCSFRNASSRYRAGEMGERERW